MSQPIKGDYKMSLLTVTEARSNLYKLIDQLAQSHQPIYIKGKRHNAVLIDEEDWTAIQETLYLQSIPGMRESITKGMKTPIDKCKKDIDW